MLCNILKDPMQCTHAKWFMTGNRKVMRFAVNHC
jgi:hypothetical protein